MNARDDEKLRELLKRAIAPVTAPELERDLWPQMLRKMDERAIRLVWFEWAMIAFLGALCFTVPEVIPGLLYLL